MEYREQGVGNGNGLGDGGRILHDWVFGGRTPADAPFLEDPLKTLGAFVLGRRTFDIAEGAWGDQPPFSGPVFVLTHRPHEPVTRGPVTFTFVTGGLERTQAVATPAVTHLRYRVLRQSART